MDQLSQEHRLISIASPLSKDELLLTSFEGDEYISRLFEYKLEVLSSNLDIKPEQLIGEQVVVSLQDGINRKYSGYVSHFTFGEIKADNLRQYTLTIVPWLWFLGKTNNHRVFQDKNTKDIVSGILKDYGFNDFDFKAQGGKKREYCVQFNESDLHFISRLLEEDGIAYFFKQKNDVHKLILVDKENAYEFCKEKEVTYSKGNQTESQITQWEHAYQFRKGEWTISDYNFKEPRKKLVISSKTKNKYSGVKKYEHYEYPAMYDTTLGKELVSIRMEAEEATIDTIAAVSDCSTFYAGGKFTISKHAAKSEKDTYIITGIHHRAIDSSYFSGHEGKSEYGNNFVCIPDKVHFRPLNRHNKPSVNGPLSALVTGPSGDEIYIDEFGRIKVQFFWDREGKNDENTTCFIRVVQPWAGKQWGTSFIPRIGMEVIVNFINGDPDRPLITGSVYNANNMPPFESKTQSGIKTHSTVGGTSSNYNELRFDDLKGSEQIFIHAEKNMDTEVEHDETITVDNDRTKTIKHDENSSIGNDRNKSVGNNQTESIAKDKTIDVGENHKETIGKDKTLKIADDHKESIGKSMTIDIGKDLAETVSGKYTEEVAKEYSLDAKSIFMNADDQITLKTGKASITMKSNGDITLSGNNINIKGSGNITIKGSKVSTN